MSSSRIFPLVSLIGVVAVAAATAVVYKDLPDPMPTHFDLHGQVDGWSSRAFGAWFLPAIAAAVWIAARITNRSAMSAALFGTSVFMSALDVLILRAALDGSMKLGGGLAVLLGAFDLILGLVFPRLRRNRWVGIRLPWTLSSDENWARAHRFGGAVFAVGGLATLACAALLGDARIPAALMILIAMAGIVTVQSYRLSRST